MTRGAELARLAWSALAPRLTGIACSAALIGPGSEVLGYDDHRSTDHDWPPRLTVFTDTAVDLPGVRVTTLAQWRPFDPAAAVAADWLGTPWQRLAEAVGGVVLHDPGGSLTALRAGLAWYPDDVWRYVLACQWRRVAQQEAFPGRCREVGDLLGAAAATGSLTRDLMRLALLQARVWPPYAKWLGTAFGARPDLARVRNALLAGDVAGACAVLARRQNDLGLHPPLDPTPRRYFTRPYPVIGGDRFVAALLPGGAADLRGSVDQWVDSADVLMALPVRGQ